MKKLILQGSLKSRIKTRSLVPEMEKATSGWTSVPRMPWGWVVRRPGRGEKQRLSRET